MKYNFDQMPDRRSTEAIKWHYYAEGVLPMWVADMDFLSPEPVIQALGARVSHGVFGYPGEPAGLRQAVLDHLLRLYGWSVEPEALVFVPGVVTAFNMAAQAFVGAGEGLLIQPPVYMPFLSVARNVQGIQQEAELQAGPDGHYRVDLDAFEDAITGQTRMFLLCNPHNPVGRVFTREELEGMAEICLRHRLVICSDEIHSDLVFSGSRHVPLASISPEIAHTTITLMAPSKTFNIAGLACSFAVIPNPELRKRFERGGLGMVHGVNLLGLEAARAAYQDGREWMEQLMVYLEGNRDFLTQAVNQTLPGIHMHAPEGTYLAWLDCREAGIPRNAGTFFTEQARVGLIDGEAFGRGGEGFLRLNFGCPRTMLEEALDRMRQAVLQKAAG
jgi:cystathionine beta-lyase